MNKYLPCLIFIFFVSPIISQDTDFSVKKLDHSSKSHFFSNTKIFLDTSFDLSFKGFSLRSSIVKLSGKSTSNTL